MGLLGDEMSPGEVAFNGRQEEDDDGVGDDDMIEDEETEAGLEVGGELLPLSLSSKCEIDALRWRDTILFLLAGDSGV